MNTAHEFERLDAVLQKRFREIDNENEPKYKLKDDCILPHGIIPAGTIGKFETVGRLKDKPERRYSFENGDICIKYLEETVISSSNVFEKCV